MERIKSFLNDPLNRFFVVSFITVNSFKLWAMQLFPITCDEAYYWLWHKHLSISYVDHPAFIAYFNKFISLFGEYNLFNFRLAGLTLAIIATYFIYKTGETLFDRKVGIIAATLFLLIPHYIIIWLTVTIDNPLAMFWALALYFFAKIYKEGKPTDWYWFAFAFGFGVLSKYTMVFFLLPVFLILIFDKNQRGWLFKKEPYLAFLLSIVIFSPIIIWNVQHNFISFLFHSGRLGKTNIPQNILDLIGDQLVHFTPFLFLGFIIYARQLWQKSKYYFAFSIPLLLIFLAFTFVIKVWAHWVIVYQFAALSGVAVMIAGNYKVTRRVVIAIWVFDIIAVSLILFGSSMLLPRQAQYQQNYSLVQKYQRLPPHTYIMAPYHGMASELAFYTHQPTFMVKDYLRVEEHGFGQKQFDLWGGPDIKRGENIVYFGPANLETKQKLKKQFARVVIRPDLDLYAIESYLDDLVPYYCTGFKGAVSL
ncbi:MAG: glycosyltransferase family 39 protein [bacterium]